MIVGVAVAADRSRKYFRIQDEVGAEELSAVDLSEALDRFPEVNKMKFDEIVNSRVWQIYVKPQDEPTAQLLRDLASAAVGFAMRSL